jgi:hypothetical protein
LLEIVMCCTCKIPRMRRLTAPIFHQVSPGCHLFRSVETNPRTNDPEKLRHLESTTRLGLDIDSNLQDHRHRQGSKMSKMNH